jgi:hypothetical protein
MNLEPRDARSNFLPHREGGAERSEAEGEVARCSPTPPSGLLRFASQTTSPTQGEENREHARYLLAKKVIPS